MFSSRYPLEARKVADPILPLAELLHIPPPSPQPLWEEQHEKKIASRSFRHQPNPSQQMREEFPNVRKQLQLLDEQWRDDDEDEKDCMQNG